MGSFESGSGSNESDSHADCYDVYLANLPLPGTYTLQPTNQSLFKAYCLEYGWTVIQSRGQYGNAEDYFLKNWEDYVKGFGEPGT